MDMRKYILKRIFFIKDKSYFVSDNNKTNEEEIVRQSALSRVRIASNEEIKIFCGAMKKKYVNSIIPFSLHICIGARIMLLQNLDIAIGLINGARGTVKEYLPDIDTILVMFDFQTQDQAPRLVPRKNSVEYQINDGKILFMHMFPLKFSWAVTAHKSQGQTLEKAAIHIGKRAFALGSFYVALSRVKSLKNLLLFGLEEWPKGGPDFHSNEFIQAKENEPVENEII